MIVYDSRFNVIEDPDYDLGYIQQKELPVVHEYVVTKPAVTHEEVVAVYPETGGKDVKVITDEPEDGYWKTYDEAGKVIENYPSEELEGFPKDEPFSTVWVYDQYVPYTPDELAEIEEQRKKAEAEQEKREQQQEWLEEAPARVDAIESGVNDAYEATAELGVEVADHAVTLDDIMNAVAELGVELEAING